MKNNHYLIFAITGVLYIWHSISLPYGIMVGAGHDDGWFMHRAMNLLHGDWFGPYNQMTLIKGPVYPFFLALTSATGVSLQFSTAFFHLIASYVLIYSLSEYLVSFKSKYTVLILLLISQFPIQRVIRDEVSSVLLLLIFSLTLIVFFKEKAPYKKNFSALLGILLGLIMLTREDGGLTAAPMLLFAIALRFLKCPTKDNIKKTITSVSILVFFSVLINISYKFANYLKYDSYVGVELLDSDFGNAVSAIYSVREDTPQRYVEVSNVGLDAISRVSPTFHSLLPLDGLIPWRINTCTYVKSLCGQIGTGYFMWALRDVMFLKGYYATAEIARINYKKITSEIRGACDTGKIKCANKYFSKAPAYELFEVKELIKLIKSGIKATLFIPKTSNQAFRDGVEGSEKSAEFLNISHYVLPPEPAWIFYKVSGWYYDKTNSNSWFNATIANAENSSISTVDPQSNNSINETSKLTTEAIFLERQPSPDIADAYHDSNASMQRFNFYAPCKRATLCILSINSEVIGNLQGGIETKYHNAKGIFYIDTITDDSKKYQNTTIEKQKATSTSRYNFVAKIYNHCTKALFVGGIISACILILLGLKKRMFETPVLIIIVLWFIYFWRVFFLSLISFYWIPTGMNHLYLYPAIVFMPIASFMSIYILYDIYLKQYFFDVKIVSRGNEEVFDR